MASFRGIGKNLLIEEIIGFEKETALLPYKELAMCVCEREIRRYCWGKFVLKSIS